MFTKIVIYIQFICHQFVIAWCCYRVI